MKYAEFTIGLVLIMISCMFPVDVNAGSAINDVSVDGSTTNEASGPSSGDQALAITNSVVNQGSGSSTNSVHVTSVDTKASGEDAVAISNSVVNTTSGNVVNKVRKNKVVNFAGEGTVSIRNSVVRGRLPK